MLREFKLPADADVMIDLIPKAFNYPENPAWSFQADDQDNMVDEIKMIKRMWPVLRVIGALSPSLRNIMRGFIWEESGKPVALVNTGTQNTTGRWFIGNVAVLPEYRRRGLARKLVEAAVELARKNKANMVWLDVIAGNVPAYKLYEMLGFAHFETSLDLDFKEDHVPAPAAIPAEYRVEPLSQFDWHPRYELLHRITPDTVQRYQPVIEDQFKIPLLVRPLAKLITLFGGTKNEVFIVRQQRDGQVVAVLRYSARTRAGGVNNISVRLDPAHGILAPSLVRYLLNKVWSISPQRRISVSVESWQPETIQALCDVGFTVNHEMHKMALMLS